MIKRSNCFNFIVTLLIAMSVLIVSNGTVVAASGEAMSIEAEHSEENFDYESVLIQIDEYVRSLDTVTDGESEISREELSDAISQDLSSLVKVRSYFYSDSVELANVLASFDGVSTTNLAKIMYYGYLAQDEAKSEKYSDAYRHSTWNFRATVAINSSAVRIYTIDYEWANELVDIWEDYFDERYDYYYDLYYRSIVLGAIDASTITTMAEADADDYACAYKEVLQSECKSSYSTFLNTFDSANIMDLWNNKVGRDYGTNHPSYTPEKMFTTAQNAGELILNESDVISSNYRYVWQSVNMWYVG